MKTIQTTILIIFILVAISRSLYAEEKSSSGPLKNLQESTFQKILKGATNPLKKDSKDSEEIIPFDTPPARNPFVPQLPKEPPAPPTPIPQPGRGKFTPQTPTGPKPPTPPPAPVPTVTAPSVSITGVIWNSKRPQAIVNNRVVDIGDKIDSWVIKEINKDNVVILYAEKEFVIHYNQ